MGRVREAYDRRYDDFEVEHRVVAPIVNGVSVALRAQREDVALEIGYACDYWSGRIPSVARRLVVATSLR